MAANLSTSPNEHEIESEASKREQRLLYIARSRQQDITKSHRDPRCPRYQDHDLCYFTNRLCSDKYEGYDRAQIWLNDKAASQVHMDCTTGFLDLE